MQFNYVIIPYVSHVTIFQVSFLLPGDLQDHNSENLLENVTNADEANELKSTVYAVSVIP